MYILSYSPPHHFTVRLSDGLFQHARHLVAYLHSIVALDVEVHHIPTADVPPDGCLRACDHLAEPVEGDDGLWTCFTDDGWRCGCDDTALCESQPLQRLVEDGSARYGLRNGSTTLHCHVFDRALLCRTDGVFDEVRYLLRHLAECTLEEIPDFFQYVLDEIDHWTEERIP